MYCTIQYMYILVAAGYIEIDISFKGKDVFWRRKKRINWFHESIILFFFLNKFHILCSFCLSSNSSPYVASPRPDQGKVRTAKKGRKRIFKLFLARPKETGTCPGCPAPCGAGAGIRLLLDHSIDSSFLCLEPYCLVSYSICRLDASMPTT